MNVFLHKYKNFGPYGFLTFHERQPGCSETDTAPKKNLYQSVTILHGLRLISNSSIIFHPQLPEKFIPQHRESIAIKKSRALP